VALVCATVLSAALPAAAFAQDPAPTAPPADRVDPVPTGKQRVGHTLLFFGGAAIGLAAHESGHVITGNFFSANPRIEPLRYGFIPFFKVEHDQVTRKREFVISSAGMWVQYADSEWILTARPHLRDEHAPILKGILAFDVATSLVYSVAAFGTIGPPERDTRGIADSLGKNGAPEPAIGALILAPAVFDSWRFLDPSARWPKWASRGAKVTLALLTIAAGKD
jgi:hypothetical protein